MNESRDTFGRAIADTGASMSESQHDGALRPYQDTAYFQKRFLERNRYLRHNPELSEAITGSLRTDDDQSLLDVVTLLDGARQNDSVARQSPIVTLLAQLSLNKEVNDAKVSLVGLDAPADRANAIMTLTQGLLVDQLDDEAIQDYRTAAWLIRQQFATPTFQFSMDIDVAWYTTKLSVIEGSLDNRQLAIRYIDEMPGQDVEMTPESDAVRDTDDIAVLFGAMHRHQRYGVKMGYKRQARRAGTLIYSPNLARENRATDGNINVHQLSRARDQQPLCHIIDSPTSSFTKRLNFHDIRQDGVHALELDVATRGAFDILPNGELRGTGTGILLRDIARRRGKYAAYRQLQAEVLSDYLDLTNPADTPLKKRQNDEPRFDNVQSEVSELRTASDIVRDILLARLPSPRSTEEEGEKEESENQGYREVRLHGVIWHIRRLPQGWKASPDAEALAIQAGITLRDGETFVRPHSRGSKKLGEVVVHRIVKRSQQ